jgi:uroporphyrinogen decarboxylase
MERLAESAITFIDAQLSHGAAAYQLFDSWAGSLSRRSYDRYVLPHSRHVFRELRRRHPHAPAIHFGIGCDHLLAPMLGAGPTVLGLDWRTPIAEARQRLGGDLVVQGNLDPALVLAGHEAALDGTRQVLRDNELPDGSQHPGHIFNLGHGVQPDTDPAVLQAVVDLVHERTSVPEQVVTS